MKRQLKILDEYDDWRDIPVGSQDWELYKEMRPKVAEEMDLWAHGPIFCYGRPLGIMEARIIEEIHRTAHYEHVEPTKISAFELLTIVHNLLKEKTFDWLYLKGFPQEVTISLNTILSTQGAPIRVKPELLTSNNQHYPSP